MCLKNLILCLQTARFSNQNPKIFNLQTYNTKHLLTFVKLKYSNSFLTQHTKYITSSLELAEGILSLFFDIVDTNQGL